MKVKLFVAAAVIMCRALVQGQDYPLGVRAQALGGSGVAFASDPEGQLLNPALLAGLNGWGATVFYSHPFGVREIALSSLCLRGQIDKFACGGAIVRLAHESFEDQLFQFSLARSFSFQKKSSSRTSHPARLAFGLQAGVREIGIPGYGKTHAVIVNFGTVARLNEQLVWGARLGNLFDAKIGAAREPLPREMSLGISYIPKSITVFQFEVYKESDFPLEFRGGVEYRVLPPLSLRMGIGSSPDRLTFGMALWLRFVVFHFAAFSHDDLGWTQQYAVTLRK